MADSKQSLAQNRSYDRDVLVAHVLRYELYRHRDITDLLSNLLDVTDNPDAFNRSTWDILYFLMQSYLEGDVPSVTDIYLATEMSKGTAIAGLSELERRHAVKKVRDKIDGRRRMITISDSVRDTLEQFVADCGQRLDRSYSPQTETTSRRELTPTGSADPLIDLLNHLSHELRTPLTAIQGFSEMIADETLGPVHPSGYAEYARDIRAAAAHLLNALNELVDTTLADNGISISLSPLSPVDLEGLVDGLCRQAVKIAERRQVTLRRKWGDVGSPIHADKDRLEQVLKKLIEATVQMTRHGQTVDVETTVEDGNTIVLTIISPESPIEPMHPIADHGIGNFENEDLVRGMALIKSVITSHGGVLTMEQINMRKHVTTVRLRRHPDDA